MVVCAPGRTRTCNLLFRRCLGLDAVPEREVAGRQRATNKSYQVFGPSRFVTLSSETALSRYRAYPPYRRCTVAAAAHSLASDRRLPGDQSGGCKRLRPRAKRHRVDDQARVIHGILPICPRCCGEQQQPCDPRHRGHVTYDTDPTRRWCYKSLLGEMRPSSYARGKGRYHAATPSTESPPILHRARGRAVCPLTVAGRAPGRVLLVGSSGCRGPAGGDRRTGWRPHHDGRSGPSAEGRPAPER